MEIVFTVSENLASCTTAMQSTGPSSSVQSPVADKTIESITNSHYIFVITDCWTNLSTLNLIIPNSTAHVKFTKLGIRDHGLIACNNAIKLDEIIPDCCVYISKPKCNLNVWKVQKNNHRIINIDETCVKDCIDIIYEHKAVFLTYNSKLTDYNPKIYEYCELIKTTISNNSNKKQN